MTLHGAEPPAGLLLAAGEGSRLGRPKAAVEFRGERLVDRGVRTLRDAGCSPVLVVTGAEPVEVIGAVVVPNPAWRTGMASSLRTGLAALPPSCPAVVITLVDQPLITATAIQRLITAYENGAEIAVATYNGAKRNPVLLTAPHMAPAAESAKGDQGARTYLQTHKDRITEVPCDDAASPEDIDTPEDLTTLTRKDTPAT